MGLLGNSSKAVYNTSMNSVSIHGKRMMGVFTNDIINSKSSGESVVHIFIKKSMILFSMYCTVFIFNTLLYFFVKVISVSRRNVKIK